MISVEEQNGLLASIAKQLDRKITVYAIGGTAMMFMGIKDETLDIDLVFNSEDDRKSFEKAAKGIGYREQDLIVVYGMEKRDRPEMLKLKDVRLDLFLNKVIHFVFSDSMKGRTEQTHYYGENLVLKVANHNDILLMKCATDRIKDKDDARRILEIKGADWKQILSEAKNQVKLGKKTAFLELGEFLEDLRDKMHVDIPVEVLSRIFSLLEEQVQEKMK